VLSIATLALYLWASSSQFEGMVRKRLVATLEESTGGRVEIDSFHWRLLHLEADAGGLTIHGLEAPNEAPFVRVENLRVRISILDLLSPRVLLRDLDISQPALHIIVYADGSTNQPQPHKHAKPGKSALDTFFDLRAGHVSVQRGALHYENRAAAFDFQNRFIPLDFDANDVSLLVSYVAAAGNNPEMYHAEAGAAQLNLSRGNAKPMGGYMQATLDLTRDAVFLRSLRVSSTVRQAVHLFGGKAAPDHTVEVSGVLNDFAHPRWHAKAVGDLDLKLLDPLMGYPFAREGVAHLDLDGAGAAGEFRADGNIHVEDGSYIGTGVYATGIRLDAHVHADQQQLLLTSVVARLRQGGQLTGSVTLNPWLPEVPGGAVLQASDDRPVRVPAKRRGSWSPLTHARPEPAFIPVNGKVTAEFKEVSLDTILSMVSQPPFQHLGFDSRVNGQATATWSNGDTRSVVVGAMLNLAPSGQPVPNEVPASGSVDATYSQRDGAVDLRQFELQTPASQLEAHGQLGAFPLTSPSGMDVEFHSSDLREFDTVLRDLGLNRNGKSGTAALPVGLAGRVDLADGKWTGSLVDPHIAGEVKATELAIEMPVLGSNNSSLQPSTRLVQFDSVEATGSYSAQQVAISHALLQRGKTEISLSGTLDAPAGRGRTHAYDASSILHAHLQAGSVDFADAQSLLGRDLPVAGTLNAQLNLDGPVRTLGGSGWVELNSGSFYGEPVTRLRAEGAIANDLLKLSSVSVSAPGGSLSATGSYDLHEHRFQVDGKGADIDVAKIESLERKGVDLTGKLSFSVSGSGTLDDPHLEAHATMNPLALSGESLGGLDLVAQTANRSVTYDATTRLEGAELKLHGQTELHGDNATEARLEFSHFNIDALLKSAHVQGLTGESALAGTITVEGPLAHPEQLRGDARLQQLEVTVAGVHLASQGGVHATLANARINLDPLHITGEETDLRAEGGLSLKGNQQLDLAASGSVNLKLAETLDRDLTAGGTSTFQVEAHGPLKNPGLQGQVDFQNASLSLEDIPNGLSQLHGTLVFNQNRLEVKSLTAMSGGGQLSVGGYLAYQHGIYADLSVTGNGIRIRYPQGVSSQADATLHLQGSQNNLLLSGNVLITRFILSPDLDIAALAAQANSVQTIAPPDAPSNHIRLDVQVLSSQQLNFQNAYAKLAGDVDLHLRGTVATPSLLGRVSITEGSAMIAGTRYDLQRGDIYFTNPVRIEPSIDLNATAHVEDYDITLGLHGTPDKLAVTYRSDPPLPEADVVALLALGRTENQQRIYTQQQEQSLSNPTTDALLGGALNATVSSRVQKLFGAGSVKVDPNYLGALGNPTSRIIVEEQLGRNLTLTYATNVNTTSQQLIQAEVAINRHVSVLVARDESGVFSMVVKATRRYR
jgi:translocation and assembly module TamB